MAEYTTTFPSKEAFSTTAYVAAKEITDQIDYELPLLACMEEAHGKGSPKEDGGTQIYISLGFSEHSVPTELSTGYEPINLDIEEVGEPGVTRWADSLQPVVISGHEKRINRGAKHKILDIVDERTKAAMSAYRRRFHKRSWGTPSVGLTDVNTVNGDNYADGFLESVAPPGQTNVVMGVSKADYSFSVGWQNQAVDAGDSFSQNGLQALDEIGIEIMTLKTVSQKFGKWFASRAGFRNLKRDTRTFERYINKDKLDAGRLALYYNGYEVLANRDAPVGGGTIGSDSKEWTFTFLDLESLYFLTNGPDYFRMGTFETQSGYDVTAANIHLMGQWCAKYLGSSGIVFNGDTWS